MKNNKIAPETKAYLLMQLESVEKSCKGTRNFCAIAAISCGIAGSLSFALGQIPGGVIFVSSASLSVSLAIKNHIEYKHYKTSNDLIRNENYQEYLEKYSNSNNEIQRTVCNLLSSELMKKEIKNSDIFPELKEQPNDATLIKESSYEDKQTQTL